MLKNGKFIKENPVRIGVHYVTPSHNTMTDEERLIQSIFMGYKLPRKQKPQPSVFAYLVIAYLALIGIVLISNILTSALLG